MKNFKALFALSFTTLGVIALAGCPGKSNSPTTPGNPTATNTPVPGTPTSTATLTSSGTPTSTATTTSSATPTGTATLTATLTPTSTATGTATATPTATATTCGNYGYTLNNTISGINNGYYYAVQLTISNQATTLYSLSATTQNGNYGGPSATYYLALYDNSTGNLLAIGSYTSAYSAGPQVNTVPVTPVALSANGVYDLVIFVPNGDPLSQVVASYTGGSSTFDYGTYGGSTPPSNYSGLTSDYGGFGAATSYNDLSFQTCP